MKIARTLANQILSRAALNDDCLLAILHEQAMVFCSTVDEMSEMIRQSPNTTRIYNQHEDAIRFMETNPLADDQIGIEVFQQTEGVFGLRAWRCDNRMQVPETLEYL